MKLYIPKGTQMTASETTEWIGNVEELTNAFNKEEVPIRYPLRIEDYLIMKKKSRYKRFITQMWQEHYDRAEKFCLDNKTNFLRDDLLNYAFFLSAGGLFQKIQLPYLESKWDEEKLRYLLTEDHFMDPYITSAKYRSSESLINHLTHLTEFEEKSKADINTFKTIVEFGGGYGGMCRLFRRMRKDNTHVIIDLPVFLIIQAYYLENIFGIDQVNLVVNDSDKIQRGKINLIEISDDLNLRRIPEYHPDLFVATWSLSEANDQTQKYFYDRRYFDAGFILIGYRHYETVNPRQPCSDRIEITPGYQIIYRAPSFWAHSKEQYYLFAKRRNFKDSSRKEVSP